MKTNSIHKTMDDKLTHPKIKINKTIPYAGKIIHGNGWTLLFCTTQSFFSQHTNTTILQTSWISLLYGPM